MKKDMVLQEAHHIANVLGRQIDDARLQEAMDNSHPWQIDIYDGQFGICVTLTHVASVVTNYSNHRDWSHYLPTHADLEKYKKTGTHAATTSNHPCIHRNST